MLYKKSLRSSAAYKNFQCELLDNELASKTERFSLLSEQYVKLRESIHGQLSFFEFRMFKLHDTEIIQNFQNKCKKTHLKNLQHLGIYNELRPCDPKRVVHNLSSKPIPSRVRTLLAFGLDFRLPVWKLNFFQYHCRLRNCCTLCLTFRYLKMCVLTLLNAVFYRFAINIFRTSIPRKYSLLFFHVAMCRFFESFLLMRPLSLLGRTKVEGLLF